MWNGAAPILNAMPATRKTTPKASMVVLTRPDSTTRNTWPRLSEPVAPYSMDMPYSRKPEASAPSTKYLMADSEVTRLSRRSATSA